jgi:uncharacterized protein with von Willebrand factor type A (vWA) domain
MDKELRLARLYEFEHLLHMQINEAHEKNDEKFREMVQREVDKAVAELEDLKGVFDSAEEVKKQWDDEDARLRKDRSDMDSGDKADGTPYS